MKALVIIALVLAAIDCAWALSVQPASASLLWFLGGLKVGFAFVIYVEYVR